MRKQLSLWLASVASTGAVVATALVAAPAASSSAPTAVGVTGHTLTEYSDSYKVQHPYNLPESARFSVTSGPEYNAWIYKNDKPYSSGSKTGPRTEMRWGNWIGTEHMWEADVLVDKGSTGVCIMQVKSNTNGEKGYLQVRGNGDLYDASSGTKIATGIWGKWTHITVDYDPASGLYRITINGKTVSKFNHGKDTRTTWYFKNGVYGTISSKSEAHFKNIKFWRR